MSTSSDGFAIKVVLEFGNDTNVSEDILKDAVLSLGWEVVEVEIDTRADGSKSVVVILDSSQSAKHVVAAIQKELDKGDECDAGVLCQATDVFVEAKVDSDGAVRAQCFVHVVTVVVATCVLATKPWHSKH